MPLRPRPIFFLLGISHVPTLIKVTSQRCPPALGYFSLPYSHYIYITMTLHPFYAHTMQLLSLSPSWDASLSFATPRHEVLILVMVFLEYMPSSYLFAPFFHSNTS